MTIAYLGLGSNVGDRQANIDAAIRAIDALPGTEVMKVSTIIETEPVGGPPQGPFLNGAVEIDTELTPRQLLDAVKGIERGLGRVRTVKDGPRTIDIDILLYGDLSVREDGLRIPHPRMHERDFVKIPLREIA